MSQYLLGEAEALAQINQFCDWYGIDLEERRKLAEDNEIVAFEIGYNAIIKAFRKGNLEVQLRERPKGGETLVVLQRLEHPLNDGEVTEIVYNEITGATKADIKLQKNMTETAARWATLAVVSGTFPGLFRSLRGYDIQVAEVFGFLFLLT